MDTLDIALRLGAAAFAGAALGLNRDLRGKPTGVRTLGIVGLGSAMVVLVIAQVSAPDTSRVIQGVLTGIGFIGAGVIVRNDRSKHVHGFTTAACVWLTACVGAACGIGEWRIILLSVPLIMVLLLLGGPFERMIHRRWPGKPDPN